MPATPQPIGFAVASREATFPSPSEIPVGRPFPAPLRCGFMRSGVISSSKFSSPLLPVAPRPSDHSCWGSCPLRDITDGVYALSSTGTAASRPPAGSRQLPRCRFVPSTGFLNLSTVCSAFGFAGLFHPAATSRVFIRSGVSPVAQRFPARRRVLPPCRCCAPTGRRPGRRERASRLRGLIPCDEAFLGVRV
jgi:hypothetical protein